jgi:CubicO group peptidase (beta-lactamase class C family)
MVAVLLIPALSATEPASILRLDGSKMSIRQADAFARKTLADAHVTGAQIAVVNRGKLVWSAAYGFRRRGPDQPMDRQTVTWAASITKSVFATYVMQLMERREFDIDKPVVRFLPKPLDQYEEYRAKASDIIADTRWLAVTPRMLLSHTSGLANFAAGEPDQKMHLHFKPGTQYLYSGEGFNLLQLVVEQQKGKTLDVLMQDAVFTPLGMTRTGLTFRNEFEANAADRYDLAEKFRAQVRRYPPRGAGSMTTTAEDLARFAAALLNGKLIKQATVSTMMNPFIQIRSLHQFAFQGNEAEGKEAADCGLAYGAGWGLLTQTRFGPAFFKEGHGDGGQAYMICFHQQKSCMILLTNSDNGELAFRPLLETILGDTVTPWEWEGYTKEYILNSRASQP